jgi:glycosyltransferase involved in cell wall biosynthesis
LEKGDKLRAYQQIRELSLKGHEIHLFCLSDIIVQDKHLKEIEKICVSVTIHQLTKLRIIANVFRAFFQNEPVQVSYFYDHSFHQLIKKRLEELKPDVLFFQLVRMVKYHNGINKIPAVLDFQDAFSKGMKQRSTKGLLFKRWFFSRESSLLVEFENNCFRQFEAFSIISNEDRKVMDPTCAVEMTILPNLLELAYFKPLNMPRSSDVLFVGNMGYSPNVEAVIFLVKEIMPLVWEKRPHTKVMLAGANPSKRVKDLASENVIVTGWVEDIRTCYADSKIFVAPMVSGTGLQNKLLEALAMGLPSITTPICAKSLAPGYENLVYVHTDARDFAGCILELLSSDLNYDEFMHRSRSYIRDHYDSSKVSHQMEQLLSGAIQVHKLNK